MSGSGGCQRSLARANPSPVVELNRAAAVGMRDGPSAGLALVDVILERGDLADYRLAHSAPAVLYRRLGRTAEARVFYERALGLTRQEPERRFVASDGWPSCRTETAGVAERRSALGEHRPMVPVPLALAPLL